MVKSPARHKAFTSRSLYPTQAASKLIETNQSNSQFIIPSDKKVFPSVKTFHGICLTTFYQCFVILTSAVNLFQFLSSTQSGLAWTVSVKCLLAM